MDGDAPALRFPHPDPPATGTAVEVAPGVLWLRLPLPKPLGHVNVYALDDGAGWTLADTGLLSHVGLWETLLAGPLRGRPVTRVIATHHHPDHIGLAGWFQARGAALVATRTAWLTARMLCLDVQDRPVPETVAFWRAAGLDAARIAERAATRPFNFADVVAPLPLGFARIADGDELRVGARTFRVMTGGGHAPEQAMLFDHEAGLCIAGDQLLPAISPNIGVHATEPDADPLADYLASLDRVAEVATPDLLVLPGHGLPFRGLPVRLRQLVQNHRTALARLEAHLVVPRTAVDCFPAIFRRAIGPADEGLALAEALAHLNHLAARGRVLRRRNDAADPWLWQACDRPASGS